MGVIDFHTHAFSDALAARAVRHLEQEGNITAFLEGTTSALVASMDAAGIERSVVASIATKPAQSAAIEHWSRAIASERLIPFPSVHPKDPECLDRIRGIADAGFRGIKMHPYYQGFTIDEDRMFPIYEAVRNCGLILLMHTGFDMAFDRIRVADPIRVTRVSEAFPDLKLIATHLGAWEDWEEARKHLLGRPIYMDTSYALSFMAPAEAREMLLAHPPQYILFGTDSPWEAQGEALRRVRALGLSPELEEALLGGNAARLLGIAGD